MKLIVLNSHKNKDLSKNNLNLLNIITKENLLYNYKKDNKTRNWNSRG